MFGLACKKPISRKCKHKPATTTKDKHNPPPTTQNPNQEEEKNRHPCFIATKIHQKTTTTTTKLEIKEKENQIEKSGGFGLG